VSSAVLFLRLFFGVLAFLLSMHNWAGRMTFVHVKRSITLGLCIVAFVRGGLISAVLLFFCISVVDGVLSALFGNDN